MSDKKNSKNDNRRSQPYPTRGRQAALAAVTPSDPSFGEPPPQLIVTEPQARSSHIETGSPTDEEDSTLREYHTVEEDSSEVFDEVSESEANESSVEDEEKQPISEENENEVAAMALTAAAALNRFTMLEKQLSGMEQFFEATEGTERDVEAYQTQMKTVTPLIDKLSEVGAQCEPSDELDGRFQRFLRHHMRLSQKLDKRIKELAPPPVTVAGATADAPRKALVRTPKLEVPTFNGEWDDWLTFRDLFTALVHENRDLSNVEKFTHLKGAIKLPAHKSNVLANFTISGDRYEEAWQAVLDRYDDKRKIIAHHLMAMSAVKKMTSPIASELQRVHDAFKHGLGGLEQQGLPVNSDDWDLANAIIVHMVTRCLDDDILKEWRKENKCAEVMWADMSDFLSGLWRSLDDVYRTAKPIPKSSDGKSSARGHVAGNSQTGPPATLPPSRSSSSPQPYRPCFVCKEMHWVNDCAKFRTMTPQQRSNFTRENKRCVNCLGPHVSKECTKPSRCNKCNKRHHKLLHYDVSKAEVSSQASPQPSCSTAPAPTAPLNLSAAPFQPYDMSRASSATVHKEPDVDQPNMVNAFTASHQSILGTVLVEVQDRYGNRHLGRALQDSGAERPFMKTSFAENNNLEIQDISCTVVGVGESTLKSAKEAKATIRSRYREYSRELSFALLPSLTGAIPLRTIDVSKIKIPPAWFLADPHFNEARDVDMILPDYIGYETSLGETVRIVDDLFGNHSVFGWSIGGRLTNRSLDIARSATSRLLSCFTITAPSGHADIDEKLERLLQMDDCEYEKRLLTPEETYCEELFAKTTTLDEKGKFIVQMPFKATRVPLGTNYENARRALKWQEARRQKEPLYDTLYVEYMADFIKSGQMEEVGPKHDATAYYLPHHGVLKLSSTSTKLRPVFNASSTSETGITLNDALCVGPTIQPESYDILIRAREKKYLLTGDITKMYRQVWIDPNQRKFLRILWRENMNGPVKTYQINTVTFGTGPAPFLATRCLEEIAKLYEAQLPDVAQLIRTAFYVDDLIAGFDDLDQALLARERLRYVLVKHGFTLCKIASNHPYLVQDLPATDSPSQDELDKTITKTLGICYNNKSDQFSYRFSAPAAKTKLTKAQVLSEVAGMYDPIGWIGPVVLSAKLFMKKLHQSKFKWAEEISEELQDEWNEFREHVTLLNNLKIDRRCYIDNHTSIEIHGFCDASIAAYGAVLYALSMDTAGNLQCSLITSKSKVAPKKQKTLARLELCGAVLLAKLVTRVTSVMSKHADDITLWCDSTIALSWLRLEPSRLQTFVGNRVSAIQGLIPNLRWKHIRGDDNPADIISRGLTPQEIETSEMWWNGPAFFKLPKTEWPESILVVNEDDPEVRDEIKRGLTITQADPILTYIETRYSHFAKVVRVFAYITRAASMFQKKIARTDSPLTVPEIAAGESAIIRILQQHYFAGEYEVLLTQRDDRQHSQLPRKSKLLALAPFLDPEGIIRVGGRIQASLDLTADQKHPIILPQSNFTRMLVIDIHERNCHVGSTKLRAIVRQRYWPLKSLDLCKKVTRNCYRCFRLNPPTTQQLMSNLPPERVMMTPPFTHTALDYAGFYNLRTSLTKRSSHMKAYIALFKCMCTGAVHFELVTELSSQAFIAALDRFISRRGLCLIIFSDNGTNFVGADRELKRIVEENNRDVENHCTTRSIQWKFTTPMAPHAGGIYEAGIKSMKYHLKRVMGDSIYTYEQFVTILCKVEAVLNSRPLTPLTEDPNDLQVLTPGHFLIGRPLNAKPERQLVSTPETYLNRWDKLQRIQQQFWQKWYLDYLQTLQTRPVNFRRESQVNVGDMVVLKEPNMPPLKWSLGRIVELCPSSKDKVVRTVKVKTQSGVKVRHVKYLCFLPYNQDSSCLSRGECS